MVDQKQKPGQHSDGRNLVEGAEKRPYESPRIVEEEVFSTYTLNCKFGPGCSTQSAVRST